MAAQAIRAAQTGDEGHSEEDELSVLKGLREAVATFERDLK